MERSERLVTMSSFGSKVIPNFDSAVCLQISLLVSKWETVKQFKLINPWLNCSCSPLLANKVRHDISFSYGWFKQYNSVSPMAMLTLLNDEICVRVLHDTSGASCKNCMKQSSTILIKLYVFWSKLCSRTLNECKVSWLVCFYGRIQKMMEVKMMGRQINFYS